MEFLRGIARVMREAESKNTSEAFSQVVSELVKTKQEIRETIQASTAEAITVIIDKLENNQPLTGQEKDYLKLWVVGDAEGYVKMENNLKEWKAEFHRLTEVIAGYEPRPESVPELADLHGVVEDAIKVASNLSHFSEDLERIDRFQRAIANLDAADSKFLADILKNKLTSPDL
jgi:hypothetical protein